MKDSNVQLRMAYERCKDAREALREINAIVMEQIEDAAGIVVARYRVGERSVVLFATPHWWDVFVPVHDGSSTEDTINALKAMVQS
jgi:hypothetical protein